MIPDPTSIRRRDLAWGLGLLATGSAKGQLRAQAADQRQHLDIADYQPKSMLAVPETKISAARFPVIDIHTHLTWPSKAEIGVALSEDVTPFVPASEVLPVMDRKNLRTLVNLTGGFGKGVRQAVEQFDQAAPGRFITFTEPAWCRTNQPGYPKMQAEAIEQAHRDGARGLKVLKTLGLYLRENITTGKLVAVDDRRFDPMWEACGALNMPVAIHCSDPVAFFEPTDRYSERFEELNAHPDWSFHGPGFPSNAELLEARNRVIARHPRTQFLVLHVGNYAENLANVSACMDRFPNMTVEIAARIGELGRQPRTSRKFFDRYQDRILFGTDAIPNGVDTPQQVFCDRLYEIYFRFLETEDEYFDYAPAPVPPQGRWRIYGLGLPDSILKKIYLDNASRLLNLKS